MSRQDRAQMERSAFTRLEQLSNVGPAIAAKLRRVDVCVPADLLGRDPYALFEELRSRTGERHDPCLLDVFISVVRFMEGGPERPWWEYTADRKARLATVNASVPRHLDDQSAHRDVSGGRCVNFWVNTVSKEHVLRGIEGGFTQADHGKVIRIRRLNRGDLIVFYSPRTAFQSGDLLQAFTAIGRIEDDEPYQVEMTPTFHPWRRRAQFFASEEALAKPLVPVLDFVANKGKWGLYFRRGLFQIPEADFQCISEAMKAQVPEGNRRL